jgi:hypothetical protein
MTGHSFSPTVLEASPIPSVPAELLPWLRKDRREAVDGVTFYNSATGKDQHDRMGLTYAQRELRRIETDIRDALRANGDMPNDRTAILTIQRNQQACFVQFWEGKIWLLDRMIAAAQATSS